MTAGIKRTNSLAFQEAQQVGEKRAKTSTPMLTRSASSQKATSSSSKGDPNPSILGLIEQIFQKVRELNKKKEKDWEKIQKYAGKGITIIEANPGLVSKNVILKDRKRFFHYSFALAIYGIKGKGLLNQALDHLVKAQALTKDDRQVGQIQFAMARVLAFRDQPKEAGKTCDLCKAIQVLRRNPDFIDDETNALIYHKLHDLFKKRAKLKHPPCSSETITTRSIVSLLGSSYSPSQEI